MQYLVLSEAFEGPLAVLPVRQNPWGKMPRLLPSLVFGEHCRGLLLAWWLLQPFLVAAAAARCAAVRDFVAPGLVVLRAFPVGGGLLADLGGNWVMPQKQWRLRHAGGGSLALHLAAARCCCVLLSQLQECNHWRGCCCSGYCFLFPAVALRTCGCSVACLFLAASQPLLQSPHPEACCCCVRSWCHPLGCCRCCWSRCHEGC